MIEKIKDLLTEYQLDGYARSFYHWEFFPHTIGILTIFCYLVFFYLRHRKKTAPLKISQNDTGSVSIARRVLDDLVYTACINLGIQSRPAVSYKIKHKQIFMRIRIQLGAGQSIHEKTRALQDYLYCEFRDTLGIHDIGCIDIEVTGAAAKVKYPTPFEEQLLKQKYAEPIKAPQPDA